MMNNYIVLYSVGGVLVFDVYRAESFDHACFLSECIYNCFITLDIRVLFVFRCFAYGVCFHYSKSKSRAFFLVCDVRCATCRNVVSEYRGI